MGYMSSGAPLLPCWVSALTRMAILSATVFSCMAISSPADAALSVRAGARAGGYGDSASYEGGAGEDIVFAKAFALQSDNGDGNDRAEAGAGRLCNENDPGCVSSIQGSPAFATSGAEANANGSLKVRASAQRDNSRGSARASLTDTVTFRGSRVVNFKIDIDQFSTTDSGFGEIEFLLTTVLDPANSNNDDQPIVLGSFIAFNDASGSGFEAYRRDGDLNGDPPLFDSGFTVPSAYNFEFDFDSLCGPVCQMLGGPPPDTFEFEATLLASASVFSDGLARVNADRSLNILPRGEVVSASGYTYAISPVPLPASVWLLGAALAGLAGRGAYRRKP